MVSYATICTQGTLFILSVNSVLTSSWQNERHVQAWNCQNDAGKYNPLSHGTGPLMTSLPANNTLLDYVVMNSSQQLPQQYPFNLDLNSGNGLGVGEYPI